MTGAIQRLRAEIGSDRRAFEQRAAELAALGMKTDGSAPASSLAQAAVALHHAYGAVESIMVRTARFLDGDVPGGPDWHQTLLTSMGLEIDGIRSAIFQPQTIAGLRRLLGFRHFFRHAYAVDLDARRLQGLREETTALLPTLLADLDQLDAFLETLAQHPAEE